MTFYSYLAVLVYFSTLSQCIVFLRSLLKLVEGNLLEWGQLLSREILWWLSNFLGGGQFSPGVFVHEKIFPGGNFPWGQLSGGQLSIIPGSIIQGAIVRREGDFREGIFLRGNCPDTQLNILHHLPNLYLHHLKCICIPLTTKLFNCLI